MYLTQKKTSLPNFPSLSPEQERLMQYLCRFRQSKNCPIVSESGLNTKYLKHLKSIIQNDLPMHVNAEEYHLASMYCLAAAEAADNSLKVLTGLNNDHSTNRLSRSYYESLRNHTGYMYLSLANNAIANGNKTFSKMLFEISSLLLSQTDVFANEIIKGSHNIIESTKGRLDLKKIQNPDESWISLKSRRLGLCLSEYQEALLNPIHFEDIETSKTIKDIKETVGERLPRYESKERYSFVAKECLFLAEAIDFRFRILIRKYPGLYDEKITKKYYLSIRKYVGHLFLHQAIEELSKGKSDYVRDLFEISDLFFTEEEIFTKDLIKASLKYLSSKKKGDKTRTNGKD